MPTASDELAALAAADADEDAADADLDEDAADEDLDEDADEDLDEDEDEVVTTVLVELLWEDEPNSPFMTATQIAPPTIAVKIAMSTENTRLITLMIVVGVCFVLTSPRFFWPEFMTSATIASTIEMGNKPRMDKTSAMMESTNGAFDGSYVGGCVYPYDCCPVGGA